jgi:hypothetical protein
MRRWGRGHFSNALRILAQDRCGLRFFLLQDAERALNRISSLNEYFGRMLGRNNSTCTSFATN